MKIYKARSFYRPEGAPDVHHVVVEGATCNSTKVLLIRGYGHTAYEYRGSLNKILSSNENLFGKTRIPKWEKIIDGRDWVGCWFVSSNDLFDVRELNPVFPVPDNGEWE